MKEIVDFIKRRFTKDCNWTTGNCYYFALILHDRFPESKIIYDPIEGHFMILYNNKAYDYLGSHKVPKEYYFLDDLKENDIKYYNKLKRDCMI